MRSRTFVVLPFVVAALALAGCQGSAGEGAGGPSTPSETPMTSAAPADTSAPTASPAPSASAAATQITDTGVGTITVGEAVPADNGLVAWVADACSKDPEVGGYRDVTTDDTDFADARVIVRATDPDATDSTDRDEDDPVDLIVVRDPSITTAAGIHAGSTVDELTAAYPDFAAVYEPGERGSSQLFVLENDTAQTVFEVLPADAPADAIEGVTPGTVAWILIEKASAKAFGIANSDAGGPCPA